MSHAPWWTRRAGLADWLRAALLLAIYVAASMLDAEGE